MSTTAIGLVVAACCAVLVYPVIAGVVFDALRRRRACPFTDDNALVISIFWPIPMLVLVLVLVLRAPYRGGRRLARHVAERRAAPKLPRAVARASTGKTTRPH